MSVAVATGPVQSRERITNLDTVRGIATLGILVMNAVSFGLPEAAYFNIDVAGSDSALPRTIGLAGELYIDQKMMGLFSLLFGAGIVVFADRAEVKGLRPVRLSLWRNGLLLMIGLLHSLLWDGDVLLVYALCSPVLLLLRKRSPRGLLIGGSFLVVASAMAAVVGQNQIPGDGSGLGSYWFLDQGGLGDTAVSYLLFDAFARSLGMMLIGVALYRLGVVQGTKPRAFYRTMAIAGFSIGVPLSAAGVIWQVLSDYSPDFALVSAAPNTLATVPFVLGYLGLFSLWNQRSARGAFDDALIRRVRAVGRMALTNYLTQTMLGIVALRTVIGRGELDRAGIALFVLAVWCLQLAWSEPWLKRFAFGPFEWAWRCMTYQELQPFRR